MKRSRLRKRPNTTPASSEPHFADQMGTSDAKRRRRWWLAGALAGTLCVATAGPIAWIQGRAWTEQNYVQQLVERVEQAPSSEVTARVASAAATDDVGLEVLVRLVLSDRPEVSLAATSALDRQLSEWALLPTDQSRAKVLHLAQLLADLAPQFSARQQVAVARLGERLLKWPFPSDPDAAAELLVACEVLVTLPAARQTDDAVGTGLLESSPIDPDQAIEEALTIERENAAQNLPPIRVPTVAGSGLPIAPEGDDRLPTVMNPSLPPALAIAPSREPTTEELGSAPTEIIAREPGPFLAPRAERIEASIAARPTEDQEAAVESNRYGYLAELADLEVMQRLAASDMQLAVAAERELRQRGYESKHLVLARQLVSPSPGDRMALVERLPRLQGVDARPWLLHLAQDSDVDVASAARAILKTASDPSLQQR